MFQLEGWGILLLGQMIMHAESRSIPPKVNRLGRAQLKIDSAPRAIKVVAPYR